MGTEGQTSDGHGLVSIQSTKVESTDGNEPEVSCATSSFQRAEPQETPQEIQLSHLSNMDPPLTGKITIALLRAIEFTVAAPNTSQLLHIPLEQVRSTSRVPAEADFLHKDPRLDRLLLCVFLP